MNDLQVFLTMLVPLLATSWKPKARDNVEGSSSRESCSSHPGTCTVVFSFPRTNMRVGTAHAAAKRFISILYNFLSAQLRAAALLIEGALFLSTYHNSSVCSIYSRSTCFFRGEAIHVLARRYRSRIYIIFRLMHSGMVPCCEFSIELEHRGSMDVRLFSILPISASYSISTTE